MREVTKNLQRFVGWALLGVFAMFLHVAPAASQVESVSTASDIQPNSNPATEPFGQLPLKPHTESAITITHSVDPVTIQSGNSVSCNAAGLHADNGYWRAFDLPSFGIAGPFNVSEVEIGIETATGNGGTQPIVVNLYTAGSPFPVPLGSLTLIGTSDTVMVPDQSMTLFQVPMNVTVPAGSELIVEVFTPDGQTAGHSFFIGSNNLGETDPSYLNAADCGITDPATTGSIGFPNMMIVMSVTGDLAGAGANPDFAVDGFVNLQDPVTAGVPVDVMASVSNLGNMMESGVPVKFFVDDMVMDSTTVTLDTLQSDTVSFSWTPGADSIAALLRVQVFLPADSVPGNDAAEATVGVITGDFSVDDIMGVPDTTIGGTLIQVDASVTNQGANTENDVPVRFFVDGVMDAEQLVSLGPGESDTISFLWVVPGSIAGITSELTVQSFLNGDGNPANDAAMDTVFGYVPFDGVKAFVDSFNMGTAYWNITNDGGDCVWAISTDIGRYTLPPGAAGNFLVADSDLCGSGTVMYTTATLDSILDLSNASAAFLEFDSDWRTLDADDTARVDVSADSGATWTTVLAYNGVDSRDIHEGVDISMVAGSPGAMVRFVNIQPGWDWWWAIDNICVSVDTNITPPALALEDICYATTGTMGDSLIAPGSLLAINPATGAGTLLGNTGLGGAPGLAIKSTGEMYCTNVANPGFLFRLDATTGATSNGVNTGLFFPDALAFDGDDILYGTDSNGDLYIIDENTGGTTLIGGTGASMQGLAFDPTTGILFGSGGAGDDNIYTIDHTTGAATSLGTTGLGGSTPDIHFDDAGNLYGSKGGGMNPNDFISIDKTTGAGTVIGPIGAVAVSGLASRLDRVVVGIEDGSSLLPDEFSLHQNYPNPFNPTTTIRYDLRESSKVTLKIYNVLGQEVRTLVDGRQNAGYKSIEWDGKNNLGISVSSGLYIYRIEAGNFVNARKMMFLK